MKQVEHIILTRFNLALKFSGKARWDSKVPDEKPWLDERYLATRFSFFEKYTFSTMLGQTNKNFKWIVLFHIDTPEEYKQRIVKLERQMEQFVPLYFNDEECARMAEVIKEYIQENYQDCAVITTRIDNDDMVHKGFVQSIQAGVGQNQAEKKFILSCPYGLQYDIRTGTVLKFKYVNNHFISKYVEDVNCDNHILFYNHDEIDAVARQAGMKLIKVDNRIPLWVEMITENNYSNTLRWRFFNVFVSYKMKDEYPLLDFKWNSRFSWWMCCMVGIAQVFIHRSKGAWRMIKNLLGGK